MFAGGCEVDNQEVRPAGMERAAGTVARCTTIMCARFLRQCTQSAHRRHSNPAECSRRISAIRTRQVPMWRADRAATSTKAHEQRDKTLHPAESDWRSFNHFSGTNGAQRVPSLCDKPEPDTWARNSGLERSVHITTGASRITGGEAGISPESTLTSPGSRRRTRS